MTSAVTSGNIPYPLRAAKVDYNTDKRKQMAKSGDALPDGSFPIANRRDVANAIMSIGRASDPAAAKRHIIKRARVLGATDLLPKSWNAN